MIERVDHVKPSYIHEGLHGMLYNVHDIHMDPKNTKIHRQKSLDVIANTLTQFGQIKPLVVRVRNGVIITGNGRYQAATAILGWEYIACLTKDVTESEARAIAIADNRSSEKGSSYNLRELSEQLDEIKTNTKFKMEDFGWDEPDISKIKSILEKEEYDQLDEKLVPDFGTPIMMTQDQRSIFDQAKTHVFQETGATSSTMTDGRVMELISADYLSGR